MISPKFQVLKIFNLVDILNLIYSLDELEELNITGPSKYFVALHLKQRITLKLFSGGKTDCEQLSERIKEFLKLPIVTRHYFKRLVAIFTLFFIFLVGCGIFFIIMGFLIENSICIGMGAFWCLLFLIIYVISIINFLKRFREYKKL